MSFIIRATNRSPLHQDAIPLEIPPSIRHAPAQKDPLRLLRLLEENVKETGEKIKRAKATDIHETLEAKSIKPQLLRRNACGAIVEHFMLSEGHTCDGCQLTAAAVEKKVASRPKPIFSSSLWAPQNAEKQPVCPPAPRRHVYEEVTSLFCTKALHIIDTNTLQRDGQTYHIRSMLGMLGDHSQIYSIVSPDRLVAEVDNSQILIKIFQKTLFETMGRQVENELLSNSLRQYDELQQTDLPTCTIYNRRTARNDGYLIVEKLQPLTLPWNGQEPFNEKDRPLLEQVKNFFHYAFNSPSTLPLDLQTSNFGIKADGRLALLDFMERDEDEAFAFHFIARASVRSLSNGNREVYEELRSLAKDVNPELFIRLSIK